MSVARLRGGDPALRIIHQRLLATLCVRPKHDFCPFKTVKFQEGDREGLKDALAALKAQDLQLAVELLSRAIGLYRSDPEVLAKALEARASAHEQRKDYEGAQSDCRSMIAHFPKSPKGYLRLGKVYRLQRRPEDALRIYAVGMKRTGHEELFGRQIEATRRQLRKCLNGGLAEPAAVDPFSILPIEVLDMIWSRLTRADKLEVTHMSKAGALYRWMASPHRHSLHFPPSSALRVGQAIQSHLDIAGRRIISITCCNAPSCTTVLRLISKNKLSSLKKLILVGIDLVAISSALVVISPFLCQKLGALLLHGCIVDDKLCGLLAQSRSLRKIYFRDCQNFNCPTVDCRLTDYITFKPRISLYAFQGQIRRYEMRASDGSSVIVSEIGDEGYNRVHHAAAIAVVGGSWGPETRHLLLLLPLDPHDDVVGRLTKSSALCSLHVLTPCLSLSQLSLLFSKNLLPFLDEISIHALSDDIVQPQKLLLTIQTPRMRLICLPCLQNLSPDRQRSIRALNRYPERCRIIFDRDQSLRIANRFWQLEKGTL